MNYNYNNYDNRISISKFLIQAIIVVGFVLLLMWLFPMPNMDKFSPLLDRIFSENVDNMRVAGKAYFTVDRMPKELGETKMITLGTMLDKKMVLPFTDKDGKTCDLENSFVEVTKSEKEYIMKVNLSCGDQEDYIIEYIGCYDVCTEFSCNTDDMVAYLYKRKVTKNYSNMICPIGYTKSNDGCYKTVSSDGYKDALKKELDNIKTTVAAEPMYKDGETTYKTATDRFKNDYVSKTSKWVPGGSYTQPASCTTSPSSTQCHTERESYIERVPYTVQVTDTVYETRYEPVYSTKQECTWKNTFPCSGCAPVPKKVCVDVKYQSGTKAVQVPKTVIRNETRYREETRYRDVQKCSTVSGSTSCSCPNGGTLSGSTCYVQNTGHYEYYCSQGTANSLGTCTITKFDYADCKNHPGSTPVGNPYIQGNLKCAIKTGSIFSHYDCSKYGSDAVLIDSKKGLCEITKPGGFKYVCEDGSEPVGENKDKCYYGKTSTESAKPTYTNSSETKWEYKWSTSPKLDGWERVKKTEYKL